MVRIESVERNSLAEKNGILAGDYLISVNGNDIKDVLDYRFYLVNRVITLKIHREADLFDVVIKKKEYDDIGLNFSTYLMDEKKSCRNKCVFCFIDQLPCGMRDTLYFKDDDSRLSFLMGNYITMTNLSDSDIDRIIKMKMSPVNVSVHTTNPELRCKMMNNRFAGDILDKMKRLADGGITMNCQIVCCRGLNDGAELERSMRDLAQMYPRVSSVSIVPAGITRHREGLYPLQPFSGEECGQIIDTVDRYAEQCFEKYGSRIFFCADELYIKSGKKIPCEDYYEGYPQIENGVGLIASMNGEFNFAMEYASEDYSLDRQRKISVATGVAASGFINDICRKIEQICTDTKINVYTVENNFFGENITVAGLICGCDLVAQLKGKELGEKLILPSVMLRREGDMTLDSMTVEEIKEALGVEIEICDIDGDAFVKAVLG